jgi:hypothetical protein
MKLGDTMKRAIPSIVLAIAVSACSSASAPAAPDNGMSSNDGAVGDGGIPDAAPTDDSSRADGPADGATAPATIATPLISRGAPAFASSSAGYQSTPDEANDGDPLTAWSPSALPAWIAYDVSGAPADERQSAVVVWNALHAGAYVYASPPTGVDMPTDYVIEVNAGPGGTSAPPTTGWTQVATVSHNLRGTVETPIAMNGASWVRMSITGATDPTLAIDVDVYASPNGATDAWLFMGDSITYMTMPYAWNDLPKLVNATRPDRWPAVVDAAIGGTSTSTAVGVIDDTMKGFPGRYVVLAYGTNDNVSQGASFQMETLVEHVLAAGKVPVVPHMPWSDTSAVQANGPIINAAIDALYAKYPGILRGPDLWAAFTNRTDLIPSGDVHPNDQGREFLRQQWAAVMAAVP